MGWMREAAEFIALAYPKTAGFLNGKKSSGQSERIGEMG